MKFVGFTDFLSIKLGLDLKDLEQLISRCTTKKIKAGDYLLHNGEISKFTYYVEKGLIRKFGINEAGKEAVLQFAPEGWFVTDRESMYYNRPSLYFIQALEDSEVLLLSEDFIDSLAAEFPNFVGLNNRLMHNHIHQLTKRIFELLSFTAEERYLSFIKTYPNILLRAPQWMVASYLGMTPESLSRIRKNLAKRNFKSLKKT